jgi:hypothetical protein
MDGPVDGEEEQGGAGHHDPDPGVARELAPAVGKVAEEGAAAGRDRLPTRPAEESRRPQPQQKPRARQIAEPVDADRPPRADGRHEHAGQESPEGDGAAGHQALQGVGLLKPRRADDLGHEPGVGGAEESLAHAHPDLQDSEVPHMGHAGDEEGGSRQLQQSPSKIGGEHHRAPREAVRPHAAEQHEHRQRDQTRGLDDADVGGRATDGEHGEGQRDHPEHGAHDRGRLADEQLAKLRLAERGEAVPQPAQATRCAAAAARASPGSTSSSARAAS